MNYQGSLAPGLISLWTPQQALPLREFSSEEESSAHTLFLRVEFPDFSVIMVVCALKAVKWFGG